jgi:hypothetical protein
LGGKLVTMLAHCPAKEGWGLARPSPGHVRKESCMRGGLRELRLVAGVALSSLALSACTSNPFPSFSSSPPQQQVAAPPVVPEMPASIKPEEIVGRWGYGAYHNDTDRARTEAAARGQCGQPVVINRGPNGGVLMYLADSAQLRELNLKGSPSGKNYIGPPGPPGGPQDREIASFDGRVLVLRWMDPEVGGRYGTGVYVRCAPEGMARRQPH